MEITNDLGKSQYVKPLTQEHLEIAIEENLESALKEGFMILVSNPGIVRVYMNLETGNIECAKYASISNRCPDAKFLQLCILNADGLSICEGFDGEIWIADLLCDNKHLLNRFLEEYEETNDEIKSLKAVGLADDIYFYCAWEWFELEKLPALVETANQSLKDWFEFVS